MHINENIQSRINESAAKDYSEHEHKLSIETTDTIFMIGFWHGYENAYRAYVLNDMNNQLVSNHKPPINGIPTHMQSKILDIGKNLYISNEKHYEHMNNKELFISGYRYGFENAYDIYENTKTSY